MSENKLHLEKSLYLKQHAENPIHWWPYGEQVFKKAKELNKPIFLSIGYSSCHWCHVMAHESFEDSSIAEFLNEHFISIKVDREEYPDVDHYFQNVCSLLTGRGGWPLTIFLTPDAKPFIAGTYFPKVGRDGTPSFMDLIKHIQKEFKTNPKLFLENAEKITEEMKKPNTIEKKVQFEGHFPPPSAIMNAMKSHQDDQNGGYGKAPKFPHFPFYEWACEQILEGMIPQEQGEHIVKSLELMMMGGVYDHIKGGIHRYSVDDKFIVPHFEKMLYDQSGLLKVLAKLCQFYPSPLIFDGILQTLDYLKTEMLSDDGYFFSAQDADSEGREGLYFTFTQEEFDASFDDAPAEQRARIDYYNDVFHISEGGNFEEGLNVISLNQKFKSEFYSQDGWQEIRDIRRRLLEQRKLRLPPATDRKGISSWNFMLLSALVDLVQYCPIDAIRQQAMELLKISAEGCMKSFVNTGSNGKNTIKHSTTLENQAQYFEDYVYFAESQLRLYEISGNDVFKNNSIETAIFIKDNFYQDGQFLQTSKQTSTPGLDKAFAITFDQSYKSPVMTYLLLISRLAVFQSELKPETLLGKDIFESMNQFTLYSPLAHGEGLRALTYPQSIYRKVEVPLNWLNNPEFLEIRSHLFPRFVLAYQNSDQESYQVCSTQSCEVSGKELVNFKKLFKIQEDQNAN
jgi:hypothetical protein